MCAAIAVAALGASMPSSSASVGGRGVGADPATSAKLNSGNNKNCCNNIIEAAVEEDADLRDNIRWYFAKRQIAGYKRPRRVFRIRNASLPRNSSGKVWKHAIIRLCTAAEEEEESMLLSKKEMRSRL